MAEISPSIKLLFIGDVVGNPGRRTVATVLPFLQAKYKPEFIIANAENLDDGNGVTPAAAEEMFSLGIDVLSNGNHVWDSPDTLEYIKLEPRLLRPHNYPISFPGYGWRVASSREGVKIGVLNVLGNICMPQSLSCPFETANLVLEQKPDDVKVVVVDIHANSAEEKITMGWYLDGRVSAVIGTHTHIPTADMRILPKGTAYCTDVGMTGCYESVTGLDIGNSFKRLVQKLPGRFEVAEGEGTFYGMLLELDVATGRCINIQHLKLTESEVHQNHDTSLLRC